MDTKTITLYYLDVNSENETYEGIVKFLSCGVMEITQVSEDAPGALIASLTQSKIIGIPLNLLRRYEVV